MGLSDHSLSLVLQIGMFVS